MSTPKIRIALAGLGFGAEFIPIYLAHPNAEIAAICQRNPAKLKEIGVLIWTASISGSLSISSNEV